MTSRSAQLLGMSMSKAALLWASLKLPSPPRMRSDESAIAPGFKVPSPPADASVDDSLAAELDVHYQPIVRFDDGAVTAVEALARWSLPSVGDIAPSVFVAFAERFGVAHVLDDFVLDRSCADAEALARLYGRSVDVHVNVSANRLGRRKLEPAVARALERHRFAPDRLVLEITETCDLVDKRAAAAELASIRERGVRIALDDFGAGFSWFGRLRALPVDIIKLDSHVTHFEDGSSYGQPVCRALLKLSDKLGLAVVAEGVESKLQEQLLARMGCRLGQGFLYGRATPIDCNPARSG